MKKLKIAIYSGEIPSAPFIENLVHAVANEGHPVFLFGVKKSTVSYRNPLIRIHDTPTRKWMVLLYAFIGKYYLLGSDHKKYSNLKKLIAERAVNRAHRWVLWSKYLPVILHLPDIFHVQWAKALPEWFFLKEYFGVCIVLSLRGAHINYSPLSDKELADAYRKLFPQTDGFHAVSRHIAQTAESFGAPSSRIRVVLSGIGDKFLQSVIEKKSVSAEAPLEVLSVGRLHWKKGYHLALDTIKTLRENGLPIRYTIIGNGNAEEILFQVNDLGLQETVILAGKKTPGEIIDYMKKSDLLLLPSVEEGIANVVLEAMATGLPVLSSDCGGMTEAVIDGETGFIFPTRDGQALADKIRHISTLDHHSKNTVTQNARQYIEAHHALQSLGKNMAELYKTSIEQPS